MSPCLSDRYSDREPGPLDWHEVGRLLIYGGFCHAPLVFNWLRLAARLFPKDTLGHLAAKVFLDQTCFAPVRLSCFYVGLSTLEGSSKEGIYKEWKEKFPNTWAVRTKNLHDSFWRGICHVCKSIGLLCSEKS